MQCHHFHGGSSYHPCRESQENLDVKKCKAFYGISALGDTFYFMYLSKEKSRTPAVQIHTDTQNGAWLCSSVD